MNVCHRRLNSTDNMCEHEVDPRGNCIDLEPEIGSIEWAWNKIDHFSNRDDLKEYDGEDLMGRYGVSEEDAGILWLVIQAQTDNRRTIDSVADGKMVAEQIREAQHQSFDGWTTSQRLVIEAFLSDIGWAVYNSDPKRQPGE